MMASPSMKAALTSPASPAIAEPAEAARRAAGLLDRALPTPGEWRRPRLGGAQSRALYVRLCWSSDLIVGLAGLLGAFLVTNIGRMPSGLADFMAYRLSVKSVLLLAFFGVVWRLIFVACGLYEWERIRSVRSEARRIALACTVGAAVALVFPLTTVSGAFHYLTVLTFWAWTLLAVPGARLGLNAIATRANLEDVREVIIVGRGPRAVRLWDQLRLSPDTGYRLLGFVDAPDGVICSPEVIEQTLGTLDEFESLLMHRAVDEVLIALPFKSRYADIQRVIQTCESVGVRARYLADVLQTSRLDVRPSRPEDVLAIARTVAPEDYRKVVKRAMDVAGAALGLTVLSPVLAATAVAVRLSGPGPVIFAQARYGFNRRRFRMYKFRTMVAGAEDQQGALEELNEANGPVFKIRSDPRVTRVGRLLRKYSIDELPQLVNVLLGDMSLVGPRPLPIRDVHRFTESALMRRFSVRPGLTCLWQISGRNELPFERWIALDLEYIDGWSLGLDCRILLRTLPVVVKGEGAA
jgi:exopolysaccharide biosynthesis polyprenyl glycosylphosphotransferase